MAGVEPGQRQARLPAADRAAHGGKVRVLQHVVVAGEVRGDRARGRPRGERLLRRRAAEGLDRLRRRGVHGLLQARHEARGVERVVQGAVRGQVHGHAQRLHGGREPDLRRGLVRHQVRIDHLQVERRLQGQVHLVKPRVAQQHGVVVPAPGAQARARPAPLQEARKGARKGLPLLQLLRINARHLADVLVQHGVDHGLDDVLPLVQEPQVPVELDRADLDDLVRNGVVGAARVLVPLQVHHDEALRALGYKS